MTQRRDSLDFDQFRNEKTRYSYHDLDLICQDTGFMLLEAHGGAEHIIAAQWKVVTEFFAFSACEKQKVVGPYAGYPYGWLGPNQEALAASKGEKHHLISRKASMAAF